MCNSTEKSSSLLNIFLWGFYIIRIILVFGPQTSQLYNDEFQQIDHFAGKSFNICTNPNLQRVKTYSTYPEDNNVLPYLFLQGSYEILKWMDIIMRRTFAMTLMTPYWIVVIPRFTLCLLTFLIDYILQRCALLMDDMEYPYRIILASSFCLFTYCTRSLVNNIEAVLFALLLYLVGQSIVTQIFARKLQENYSKEEYNRFKSQPLQNCLWISIICVVGMFNRPTFFCFALVPITSWLLRGASYSPYKAIIRVIVLPIVTIPVVMLHIIINSLITGSDTLEEIIHDKFINCDLESIMINLLNRLKHTVTNVQDIDINLLTLALFMALMFGPLSVGFIKCLLSYLRGLLSHEVPLTPFKGVKYMMFMSTLASMSLSMFLDNDSVNLLPLLMPMVLLYASSSLATSSFAGYDTDGNARSIRSLKPMAMWISVNVLLTAFHAYVCNAGVLRATYFLSEKMRTDRRLSDYHIVTSHVPNLSFALFMQAPGCKRLHAYEMDDLPTLDLLEEIDRVRLRGYARRRSFKLYLLLPGDKNEQLKVELEESTRIKIQREYNFFPHFNVKTLLHYDTVEEFLFILIGLLRTHKFTMRYVTTKDFLSDFSLKLYEIKLY